MEHITHEEFVSQVVEKAQVHFEVFYTKTRTIQFRDFSSRELVKEFNSWEAANDFIQTLTDMSNEEYDDALAEQFEGVDDSEEISFREWKERKQDRKP